MPQRFVCTTLAKKALYKYSSFPFLSPLDHSNLQRQTGVDNLPKVLLDSVVAKKRSRNYGVASPTRYPVDH